MDTQVAQMLDGEWMDVKELRAEVTQQALAESGKRLRNRSEEVVSLSRHTKERGD